MYLHHNRDAQGNPIIVIDNKIVREKLASLSEDEDLRRYIL